MEEGAAGSEVIVMVKMEIIEESSEKIKILFKDIDRAFANALRRSLMSNTPKMAIETVRFQMGSFDLCLSCSHLNPAAVARDSAGGSGCDNCGKKLEKEGVDYTVWETNGALPDEMIAQRLAMVPIPTNHEQFHYEETCPNCKDLVPEDRGCPACNMIYTCKAFGSEEGTTVTAGDMIYLGDQSLEIPEHYWAIPITKLYKGQMLEFYATAVMGRGSQHAKWSPVCGVTFVPRQVGILNVKTRAKMLWDLNLEITAKDFDKNGRLEDIDKVEKLVRELHHVGDGTEVKAEFKDAITVEDVPGEFIFSFETDGSMDPQTALKMASAALSTNFVSLEEDLAAAL